jgi:hypothetical protein
MMEVGRRQRGGRICVRLGTRLEKVSVIGLRIILDGRWEMVRTLYFRKIGC